MLNARAVKQAGSSHYSMNFIALTQQQLREVGAVLAGDAGEECGGHGAGGVCGYWLLVIGYWLFGDGFAGNQLHLLTAQDLFLVTDN
jgi:hypothetical protein